MKRRQEAAEAQEKARREQEERDRKAALALEQSKQAEALSTDRPDIASPTTEDKPGKWMWLFFFMEEVNVLNENEANIQKLWSAMLIFCLIEKGLLPYIKRGIKSINNLV